jgi:hypothetical protein
MRHQLGLNPMNNIVTKRLRGIPHQQAFMCAARDYISLSIALAGRDHEKMHEILHEPIQGVVDRIPASEDLVKKVRMGTNPNITNMSFVASALAAGMQGQPLTQKQKDVLLRFGDLLELPVNLRDYAAEFFLQARLYGEPETALEQFPRFFDSIVHPAYKRRFAQHGITGQDVQEILRQNPQIDASECVFILSGAREWVEMDANRIAQFSPVLTGLAEAVFRPVLGPDRDCLGFLTGYEESQESLDYLLFQPADKMAAEMFAVMMLTAIPKGINPKLDRDRVQQNGATFRHIRQNISSAELVEWGHDDLETRRKFLEAPAPAPSYFVDLFYPDNPAVFLGAYAKILAERAKLSWDDVKPELRAKFAVAGYDGAEAIADAINADEGQQRLRRNLDIILKNSKGGAHGYVVTQYDVLEALLHPENARFANGMAIDPFYAQLHALAGNGEDFDPFYGLAPPAPQNAEQTAVLAMHRKFAQMVQQDALLSGAVTNEQLAHLLGFEPEAMRSVFERPLNNYHMTKAGTPEASPIIRKLEIFDGLSFVAEWQSIYDDQRNRLLTEQQRRAQDEAAARRRAALAAALAPKAPVDPWRGVEPKLAAAIRVKFETPEALAAGVFENIRVKSAAITGREAAVDEEVGKALRNRNMPAVTAEGFGVEIVYAQILHAMEAHGKDAARAFLETRARPQAADVPRLTVQANIVAVVMDNPNLAHILNWRLLKQAFPAAAVSDLVTNLFSAYALRGQGPEGAILAPRDSLTGITNALNTGLPEALHCQPDSLVPIDTWRSTAKVRSGRDPFPANINASNYRLVLG